jgi:hypothetical protein
VRDEYDVIVVGAGPGGSVAARIAAEDCDVLLIEKRQEIGAPVRCAEGVLKSAFIKLAQPDRKWISSYIRGYRIFAPDGTTLEVSAEAMGIEGELAYILERKIFDRELAKEAARSGADAEIWGFIGSPTIQINGQDLEPEVDKETPYQGHCRVYIYNGKPFEFPPKEMIREALKRFA